MNVSKVYQKFFKSQTSAGIILIFCTIFSLALANSSFSSCYEEIWEYKLFGHHFSHWINDGLMAIFFFLIGLELKREMLVGELANLKQAILPIFAALGGMIVPALIFLLFNSGTDTANGFGIPMATDIAFAVAVISMLGKRVPLSLKVFLTALAVIDDLGAIVLIAIFYPNPEQPVDFTQLAIAFSIIILLFTLNRMKIKIISIYIIAGIACWWFMLHSGIHATIAGVLVAFTIPFDKDPQKSLSYRIEKELENPVAYIILPLFALANTAIEVDLEGVSHYSYSLAIGIFLGLVLGKPLGIFLACFFAVKTKLCQLPTAVNFKRILGAGMLAGIGFTMSIFVSMLAFSNKDLVNEAKLMILIGSLVSAIIGLIFLRLTLTSKKTK